MREGQHPIIKIDISISESLAFKYQITPPASSKCKVIHPMVFCAALKANSYIVANRTKSGRHL
jgi:hypothetical protein